MAQGGSYFHVGILVCPRRNLAHPRDPVHVLPDCRHAKIVSKTEGPLNMQHQMGLLPRPMQSYDVEEMKQKGLS